MVGEHPETPGDVGSSPAGRIAATLGVVLALGAFGDAFNLYGIFGLALFTEQKLLGFLGCALVLVFVAYPARAGAPRHRIPWFDWVAAAIGAAACGFVAYDYGRIFEEMHFKPADAVVASVLIIMLVAEGLRRSAGTVLFVFLAVFIAFALLGHNLPGRFQAREVDLERLAVYLALDSNGVVGMPLIVTMTIVVAFIFFGNLLAVSGGSSFFTDLATALMGRYRGGPAKIAIMASGLFGSISGSAIANVVSTGVITIPLMQRGGYRPHVAGAIEAVASTGGQLMPPVMGAVAFLMAEFLQVEYRAVVLAALVPALLYYWALFAQVDLLAGRDGLKPIDGDSIPRRRRVLRDGGTFIVPFAVIILCLFWFNLRPDSAALWAAAVVAPIGILIGYQGRRMPLRRILTALSKTGIEVVQIVMIAAMAGAVIGVLNISGLGFALTQALVHWAQGQVLVVLLMAAVVSIILGMGMPTIGVYLLLAALVAPSMIELGIPRMSAHLFALYFGMLSMITPPVALAAFAAANVARTSPMRTAFAACRFGWSAYIIPFLFVLSPELVLQGSVFGIALVVVTAIAGVWLVSVGSVGFLMRPLSVAVRVLFVAAGLGLLFPASAFEGALWSDLAGLALAVVLILVEWNATRRRDPIGAEVKAVDDR
jgi:TRAP transporter 4TM/12TM fusion protein